MTVQCGRQQGACKKNKNSLVASKLHILQDTIHRMLRKGKEGERDKRGREGEGKGRVLYTYIHIIYIYIFA